jgi:hypothetical protein
MARQPASRPAGDEQPPRGRGLPGTELPASEPLPPHCTRIRRLHQQQLRQPHQLWRTVPLGRTHLFGHGGVHRQRPRQQTIRQTAANAMDQARSTPASTDPHKNSGRNAQTSIRTLVSRLGHPHRHRAGSSSRSVNPTLPHALLTELPATPIFRALSDLNQAVEMTEPYKAWNSATVPPLGRRRYCRLLPHSSSPQRRFVYL